MHNNSTLPDYQNELYHFGVKGMKWGIRRSDTYNESYTRKQRKYDRTMYGNSSEKRINRRLNQGYGIQAARHKEVVRRDRIANAKKTIRRLSKTAIGIGSAYVSDQIFNQGRGTQAVVNFTQNTIAKGKWFYERYLKKR